MKTWAQFPNATFMSPTFYCASFNVILFHLLRSRSQTNASPHSSIYEGFSLSLRRVQTHWKLLVLMEIFSGKRSSSKLNFHINIPFHFGSMKFGERSRWKKRESSNPIDALTALFRSEFNYKRLLYRMERFQCKLTHILSLVWEVLGK